MGIRSIFAFVSLSLVAAACGDDGGTSTPVDAAIDAAPDIGFNKPTAPVKANKEMSADNWVEIGPADLTCFDTPNTDAATTVAVTVNTTVTDFQSGGTSTTAGTVVTVFPNQSVNQPFPGGPYTADGNAKVSVMLPIGTKRFGYKMTKSGTLDTLLLNQTVSPSVAVQTVSQIQSVSTTTAQTLTALIGVSRSPETGVLAGAMRDCQGREMSNFIATVSTTKGTVNHVAGANTYYFSPTTGLPARHSQQSVGSKDGLFMVIELGPTPTAFVQVWGYKDDAALAADTLSLLAELPTEVIADTVITGSYEPLRR